MALEPRKTTNVINMHGCLVPYWKFSQIIIITLIIVIFNLIKSPRSDNEIETQAVLPGAAEPLRKPP